MISIADKPAQNVVRLKTSNWWYQDKRGVSTSIFAIVWIWFHPCTSDFRVLTKLLSSISPFLIRGKSNCVNWTYRNSTWGVIWSMILQKVSSIRLPKKEIECCGCVLVLLFTLNFKHYLTSQKGLFKWKVVVQNEWPLPLPPCSIGWACPNFQSISVPLNSNAA